MNFYEFSEILNENANMFNTIREKGEKLGDWLMQSYFLYDGKVWMLQNGNVVNHGSIEKFKNNANKDLLSKLKMPEEQMLPPEIEREKQIRLKMNSNDIDERVQNIMWNAIQKAGLEKQAEEMGDQEEDKIFYGKYIDATIFTHEKGRPYSGIKRIKGTIEPKNWTEPKMDPEYGYDSGSPRGFLINNQDFDPTDIIQIHDVDLEKSLDDYEQDKDYADDIERSTRFSSPYGNAGW